MYKKYHIYIKYDIQYYLNVIMENHHNGTTHLFVSMHWKTCVCVFMTFWFMIITVAMWWLGGTSPPPNVHQTSAMPDSLMNESMHMRPEMHLKKAK